MSTDKNILHYFRRISFLIFILIVFFCGSTYSDDAKKLNVSAFKEITQTDITSFKDIIATGIVVFGINFNMSIEKALEVIDNNTLVFMEVDPFNNNRYYLYDYEVVKGKYVPLAYFIWDEEGEILHEILLYQGFSKYLVGGSQNLLSTDVINRHSDLVKNFIGYPSRKEIVLDIPAIGVKSFCYYYPDHDFKVFRNLSDKGSTIHFGLIRDLDY